MGVMFHCLGNRPELSMKMSPAAAVQFAQYLLWRYHKLLEKMDEMASLEIGSRGS